jgi:hypothetical protein
MPFTRRRLVTRAARVSGALVAASALPAPPALARARRASAVAPWAPLQPPPPPLRDADYFAVADEVVRRLDRTWEEEHRSYSAGGRVIDVIYNSALLVIHAVAAERGHQGPARNDQRARLIAERLCESPPFFSGRTLPNPDRMFHTPGWLGDLWTYDSPMDKAFDPKVAEALTAAWRARAVLGLTPDTVARIVASVDSVARGPFFRFPYVRLNQINWNAELYAHAATLTGNPELLRADYRNHMRRFVAGVRRPLRPGDAHNLSPSYRFQYQSDAAAARANVDSAEYANMTLHFVLWYEQALGAGMRPLADADMAILRAWAARVQFGYWMHCGMLSWDSGLGFKRWMKAKTWAYALQGPLTIAASPRFQLDPRQGPWAKYVFDRGLDQFAIRCERLAPRHLPPVHLYDVGAAYQGTGSRRLYVARMGANAARAVVHGLGAMAAEPPPSVYSFDADIGRLSVSTRRYSAAIVADNRGAFPYGGIELARFFDPEGVPIGGIGGRPPASFGVVIRRAGRRRVLASQAGAPGAGGGSLVLTRSPHGPVDRVRRLPRDPDAGPFGALEAVGRVVRHGAVVTSRHRFTRDYVETTWSVERPRRRLRAEVLFPSWGGLAASITAVRHDGGTVAMAPGGGAVSAAEVAYFHLAGPRGGYVVVLDGGAPGRALALRVARQPSAPRAGPTLVVDLPGGRLRARIAPAADGERAREVAAGLRQGLAASCSSSAPTASGRCSKRST